MFCNQCGTELKEGAAFCTNCGAKVGGTQPEANPTPQQYQQQTQYQVKPESIGLIEAYKLFFKNYANFKGRATREEFWWVYLFNLIITAAINAIPVMGALLSLAIIIPGIALSIRRLHDTGKSGWYLCMSFIPLVGAILVIIQYCKKSDGDNQWGPATR